MRPRRRTRKTQKPREESGSDKGKDGPQKGNRDLLAAAYQALDAKRGRLIYQGTRSSLRSDSASEGNNFLKLGPYFLELITQGRI